MVTPARIQEFEPPAQEGENNARASTLEFIDFPVAMPFVSEDAEIHPLTPSRFLLGRLRDGRLRVAEPIEVVRTTEEGKCVVEAPELNEFGFGDNPSEAIADLQAAIAELYFTLDAEQGRLGPDLAAVRVTLSRKLRKADAAHRS